MLAIKQSLKNILSGATQKHSKKQKQTSKTNKKNKPNKSKKISLNKSITDIQEMQNETTKTMVEKTHKLPLQKAQIVIGFPNHLFELKYCDSIGINEIPTYFILYEHPIFFGHRNNPGKLNYNKSRLIYVRAAVLAYLDYLNLNMKNGKSGKIHNELVSVKFISVDDCLMHKNALATEIAKLLGSISSTPDHSDIAIKYWDPVDIELDYSVMLGLTNSKSIQKIDSPLFLTSESDLAEYQKKHATGRFTHSAFYDWQKTRANLKEFKFPGHSYDTENRGQMPLGTQIPALPKLSPTDQKYLQQADKYISGHAEWGAKTRPGASNQITNIVFPVTHDATHDWFQNFLAKKLGHFGKYQDSIDGKARNYLFHSCISPMLNLGLITPHEVITATHKYYHTHQSEVGVANYEGFIRQVIGWREYQRYIYLYAGTKMRQSNHFNNHGKLTPGWYSGELGVRPVDDAIKMAFRDGYLHHILRLMVMGNFMNLVGMHPDEVYRWFMEFALDSYDWVMIGNVYSMALWADGGLSMRKPYISSDTYIMTLGTYVKETTTDTLDDSESSESNNSSSNSSSSELENKHGNRDSELHSGWNRKWYVLFYDFINRNQEKLKSTYYAGLVKAWGNKSQIDKKQILQEAKTLKKQMAD
jgi:deoxyribodipyrimidine photolyase-related protein